MLGTFYFPSTINLILLLRAFSNFALTPPAKFRESISAFAEENVSAQWCKTFLNPHCHPSDCPGVTHARLVDPNPDNRRSPIYSVSTESNLNLIR